MDNDGLGKEITQNVESSVKEKEGEQIEEGKDAKQSNHPPSTHVDSVPDPRKVTADCGKSFEVEARRCVRTDGKNWHCWNNCVVGTRHCERHLRKYRMRKKSKETNKLGTSSNNVVDGISNILGSASSQFVTQNVESVFCRLSGREPLLFPPSVSEPEQSKENESSGKEKEGEQIEEGEDAKQSSHPPSTPIDSVPDPRKVTADCGKSFEVEPMKCARTVGKNWRCSNNCVLGARHCDRHLPQSKRPKISARRERRLPKYKKRKKSAETNKLGTSSNNVVDGISNILGSASSQFVTRKTDDNHKNSRKKHKGSPREEASEEAVPLVRLLRLRSVSKTDTGE